MTMTIHFSLVALKTGLSEARKGVAAGFRRWRIVIEEGLAKRELWLAEI